MNAIRVHQFGPPDVLKLEEVPDPMPAEGQVLVEVRAAGVNPADTYVRAGAYATLPPLPYIPGGDGAGIVTAVGSGVTRHAAGDRVYFSGTAAGRLLGAYATAAVCSVAQTCPLPDRVTFSQGAAVGVPYATAWRALFARAQARPGETVLVHGASGGVGIAAVQMARAAGLTTIGTAGSPQGLALVRAEGAHDVVDHREPDYTKAILDLTGGRGVDVIIEMLANVNLDRDLGLLALRGRVVVVGNRGRIEIDPRQTMGKDSSIHGLALWNASTDELSVTHAAIGAGLENGTLRPVVGRELPLAEASRAHELVMTPGARGKIVLIL